MPKIKTKTDPDRIGRRPAAVIDTLRKSSAKPKPPQAFDEKADPDRFWAEDPGDDLVPKGWISDCVYFSRGMEVPTLFTVWASLFALSAAIKREAWMAWEPDPLFANLFVVLVGPAGIVKKNQTMKIAGKALLGMQDYIQDVNVKRMKAINVVRGKLTPESIFEALRPENKPGRAFYLSKNDGQFMLGPDGKAIPYKKTSEIALILDEMAVTMGRKKYSQGLVEDLLELYECYERWDWRTVSRGIIKLRNMHTSLIAGTTSAGFRDSVTETAMGDGFMSRMMIVHQSSTTRDYPKPQVPPNGPTMEDLKKRLAWIAETTLGEYDFDPETNKRYEEWYVKEHRAELREAMHLAGLKSRRDILVRKVAFLIRAARYDNSNRLVSDQDFEDAWRLIQYTYTQSAGLISSISNGQNGKLLEVVESYIQRKGRVDRRTTLMRTKLQVDDLNRVIDQLVQEGKIYIERQGKTVYTVSRDGDEIYGWRGLMYAKDIESA